MMPHPFLLRPASKDYLWGGDRLNNDFAKNIPCSPLAETWECSTHPDGVSVVADGEFSGTPLDVVLKHHPEFLGLHANGSCELPILIKLIDAKQNLSVQVHPDDAFASRCEHGQRGKTEMWYILDSESDTSIYYGLHHSVKESVLRQAAENGTIENYLQKVPIKKDDLFFIAPGTIHAIGAGALIAEIQQCSNLTYRLYDYNRTDRNGKLRPLHIEKALAAANLSAMSEPRQPLRLFHYARGTASEFLCRCEFFQVERIMINTEVQRELATFSSTPDSFQIFLFINGCGTINHCAYSMNFFKGDCVFVPADCHDIRIHGRTEFLKISC